MVGLVLSFQLGRAVAGRDRGGDVDASRAGSGIATGISGSTRGDLIKRPRRGPPLSRRVTSASFLECSGENGYAQGGTHTYLSNEAQL